MVADFIDSLLYNLNPYCGIVFLAMIRSW